MYKVKKNIGNACKISRTLAYLSFKCGVVVELVTTLACHAGGRGFKSPPSRHFLFLLLSIFQFHFYAFAHEKFVVVAPERQINSFLFDIIGKVFDSIEYEYELKVVSTDEIPKMLQSGEADIGLGLPKNDGFLKYGIFAKTPIRTQNYYFYGRAEDVNTQRMTFNDVLMHNFTVGILVGKVYPLEVWKAFPYEKTGLINSHLLEAKKYEDNIKKLKTKTIDLFIGDDKIVGPIIQNQGDEENIYQYKNILYWEDLFCVFSKNSTFENAQEINSNIQKTLFKMNNSGELETINRRRIETHES